MIKFKFISIFWIKVHIERDEKSFKDVFENQSFVKQMKTYKIADSCQKSVLQCG